MLIFWDNILTSILYGNIINLKGYRKQHYNKRNGPLKMKFYKTNLKLYYVNRMGNESVRDSISKSI